MASATAGSGADSLVVEGSDEVMYVPISIGSMAFPLTKEEKGESDSTHRWRGKWCSVMLAQRVCTRRLAHCSVCEGG